MEFIKRVDRVIVMKDGRICEVGFPSELSQNKDSEF